MTNLIRWDPFPQFSTFRRAMDRVFDEFSPGRPRSGGHPSNTYRHLTARKSAATAGSAAGLHHRG
jgi:hypothetical protein